MMNIIVILIVAIIVGVAIAYIIREKKRGVKCIGCPAAATCPNSGKCMGNCGDNTDTQCACHTKE